MGGAIFFQKKDYHAEFILSEKRDSSADASDKAKGSE